MNAHSAAWDLIGHQSSRPGVAIILVVALCIAVPRSKGLDACSVLRPSEIYAVLKPTNNVTVTEGHSAEDTAHLSSCGYKSSGGAFLVVVISDDPAAFDNALRSRPAEVAEIPIEDLGNRALLWDSESGAQAMAAVGQKFARVALMKQPGSDPAAAQKIVVALMRKALDADWETPSWWDAASVYVMRKDSAVLVDRVPPIYPPLARQARIQGEVLLRVLIGKDGGVEKLQAVSGHPMLVPAAIVAVKQWKYKPLLVDGQPVQIETEVRVNFSLSN